MDKESQTSRDVKLPVRFRSSNILSHFFFGSYLFLPILAAVIWFSGLTTLFVLWVQAGKPRYNEDVADVAYISDVGGENENLFLGICIVTIVLYFSSVCVIRWLRWRDRLPGDIGKIERAAGWLAIIFCLIGCAGLFVLAKWNCYDYPSIHWDGTITFIIGIGFSASFQTIEVWQLNRKHENRKHLGRNAWFKIVCVAGDIILAIAFGATYMYCDGQATSRNGHSDSDCNSMSSKAAILEWTIAYGLNLYFLTLAADLWPAGKSSERLKAKVKEWGTGHV